MVTIITIVLTIVLSHTLFAQEFPRRKFPDMERLTTQQGLSQNMVYRIFQDRQGFLWFGTRDGISRYDGYKFTVFRHDPFDPASLPWTTVSGITQDTQGDIWISSFGGICKLDRRTFRFAQVPHGLGTSEVFALHGDRSGNVWVGTARGLVQYDTRSKSMRYFQSNPGNPGTLGNDSIISLYEDHAGTLWVGTAGKYLHRYNSLQGNFTRFDVGFPEQSKVYCVGEDSRGNIYCTSDIMTNVLFVFGVDPRTGVVVNRIVSSGKVIRRHGNRLEPMSIDDSDGLWIQLLPDESAQHVTAGTTLLRIPLYGDNGGTIFQVPGDQPTDRIWKIVQDRSGILWIGTENGVLKLMLDEPRFRTYRNMPGDPTSLSSDRIRGIHKDRYGTLWVGTDNGLNRLDKGTTRWIRYLDDPYKALTNLHNAVNTIFEDADGTLFIGTNSGFRIYDRKRDTFSDSYPTDTPLFAVWSFCRDSCGMLWVGTRNDGLVLYDRNWRLLRRFSFTAYTSDSAPTVQGLVWDIHLDRYGILWAATSIGLYRWQPELGTFRKYGVYPDDPRGTSDPTVCAIMEDPSGVLWFSTYDGGVNRYNRSSDDFTYITSRDGLPSNAIYGTLMDGLGRLWISSNTGLASYDPATKSCRVYNADDGLQGNEFSFNAFHKTADGEMIFGGIQGLNLFYPDSLMTSQEEAPVVVTEFRVFDRIMRRELLDGDTVEIDYDQKFFSFEFAMLNYINPGSIRYMYRMAGLNGDWIHCGDRRYASFTNLDPGTYIFMVRGTNIDGVWSTRPLRVVLKVIPPFWMTLWFKGSVIAGIILMAGIGGMLWMRSVRGKEMLRRRSVESQLQALRLQVNPHFIFNALSSIQHLILIAEKERAVDYLSRFARLVRSVLDNSERTSIPLADEIENLRNYLHLEMFRFEGRLDYSIDIDTELDIHHIMIPTMLIQPSVENAIRHGLLHKPGPGNLTITITGYDDLLHCSIEDNGVGRERAMELRRTRGDRRHSTGLRVTQERLDILNAVSLNRKPISMKITDLRNSDGTPAGTRVDLFIPVGVQ